MIFRWKRKSVLLKMQMNRRYVVLITAQSVYAYSYCSKDPVHTKKVYVLLFSEQTNKHKSTSCPRFKVKQTRPTEDKGIESYIRYS